MKLLTSVAMLGLVQVMLANEGATNVTNSNSQNSHSFLDAIMKKVPCQNKIVKISHRLQLYRH